MCDTCGCGDPGNGVKIQKPGEEKEGQHTHHFEHDHEHSHEDEYHEHDYSKIGYASMQQADLLRANDIQHHFEDIIISNLHIHLEFEKCMEIIAVSGPFTRVNKLKKSLQKLKSVISLEAFYVDKEISAEE